MSDFDAVVIGSGPNGLAAAIVMQQAGLSVKVIEGKATPGGGMRTLPLTLPGFHHDVCSAVHPLCAGSPFLSGLPLKEHGLEWVYPEVAVAHPFDDGSAATLEKSITATAASLHADAGIYTDLLTPLVEAWDNIAPDLLGPFRYPAYPWDIARFGLYGLQSAKGLASRTFRGTAAKGFFAGLAAHAIMPLETTASAAIGLVLAVLGHKIGWPVPRGGSQGISNALISYFRSLGGVLETDHFIQDYEELPRGAIKIFDVTPKQLLKITGKHFPSLYRRRMKKYRYGQGIFKMDFALSDPIPFTAERCRKAGTIHIGGTLEEIAAAEKSVWEGKHHKKPYVLLAQQSLFDNSRAPEGKHTVWAYCHVPAGSTRDMTQIIEDQIERFAPGFRGLILEKHTMNTADIENYNPNYIGGDINGGVQDLGQLFTRPVMRLSPYTTPLKDVYICSSSTPPGGGVHGMCGFHAARKAVKDHHGITI